MITFEGVLIFNSFYLFSEKILTDFEIFYILLGKLVEDFPKTNIKVSNGSVENSVENLNVNELEYLNQELKGRIYNTHLSSNMNLKIDMRRIVALHQDINRNIRICAYNSAYMVSIANFSVLIYGCTYAYLMLTSNDPKKTIHYAMMFILMNVTSFNAYNNGQRIFNQNDIQRRKLTELPWTDKPLWFKQTLHIMMTRANVDIEMRPYGIYTLNYMSFTELATLPLCIHSQLQLICRLLLRLFTIPPPTRFLLPNRPLICFCHLPLICSYLGSFGRRLASSCN
ncbi:hypothetical protein LSTR_LSTR002452 [Laodelphax striatellus]|uniref:Odorant receptor n=1 Tax=Laodelphax striatellus TaxID=195883 RepID=A0A482X2H3_LAOST|nr:hypothetical protein LSTR_LSTR002452 [Laodelphax striatellus]